MTRNAVIENCNRIWHFYGQSNGIMSDVIRIEKMMNEKEWSCEALVDIYSRILDVNGAYKTGLSLLLLQDDDYWEMKEYAKQQTGFLDCPLPSPEVIEAVKSISQDAAILRQEWFRFEFNAFEWYVKKK